MIQAIRYLKFKGEIIPLYWIQPKNWYEDKDGTPYAYADAGGDPVIRCGVGMLSFPVGSPLTEACAPHDFKYSSTVFQFYHSRAEADADLLRDLEKVSAGTAYRVFAKPFYYLARWFGGQYWENNKNK